MGAEGPETDDSLINEVLPLSAERTSLSTSICGADHGRFVVFIL